MLPTTVPMISNVSISEQIGSTQDRHELASLKIQLYKELLRKFVQAQDVQVNPLQPSPWAIPQNSNAAPFIGVINLVQDNKAREIIDFFVSEHPELEQTFIGSEPYCYRGSRAQEAYQLIHQEVDKLKEEEPSIEIAVINLFDATYKQLENNKLECLSAIEKANRKIELLNEFSSKMHQASTNNKSNPDTADFQNDEAAKRLIDEILSDPELKKIAESSNKYVYEGVSKRAALVSTLEKQILNDISYQSSLMEEFSHRQKIFTEISRDSLKHNEDERKAHLRLGSAH